MPAAEKPSVGDIGLDEFAARLAAELDAAAETCRQAQGLAARLATDGGTALDQLQPLQALDELTQRLASLSLVLLRLANQAGDHRVASGPLLEEIGLSDLARRLRAEQVEGAGVEAGDADLF
jgi:hypothetical protein